MQPIFAHISNKLIRVKLEQPYKNADRTFEEELASKWKQPDGQTLSFSLRPGVKISEQGACRRSCTHS